MVQLNKRDFKDAIAKIAERKAKREQKLADMSQMAQIRAQDAPGGPRKVKDAYRRIPSLGSLKKALDTIFSVIIRARDWVKTGGMCVFGCGRPIQCAFHFIRKSRSLRMRYDSRNVVGACFACNGYMEHSEGPFWTWYARAYGIDQMEEIQKESHGAVYFSRVYLNELWDKFVEEKERIPPEILIRIQGVK